MAFNLLSTSFAFILVIVTIQLVCSIPEPKHLDGIKNQSHNLTLGKRKHGDRLLNFTEISRPRTFLWYTKYDFHYPINSSETTNLLRLPNITFIKVTDVIPGGRGGYPTLVQGGPGSSNVTIHLESRWNKGIDFKIHIYGH